MDRMALGETATVLLVDDDIAVLRMAAKLIARAGYRVLAASSPSHALELALTEADVGLLVSDVMMPEMSGPELHRELVRRLPGLKVVYMSGCSVAVLQDHGIRPGTALLLAKPFTAGELAATLRVALATSPSPVLASA